MAVISSPQAQVLARPHAIRVQSGSYPSQRALASDLGLTHGVVRRALTDLIALGLLERSRRYPREQSSHPARS
jgi:DNA-binding transcriptional MocR family regulator